MDTAIQDFYPDDVAYCYGCGRLNEHGLHFRSRREDDEAVCTFVPRPHHVAIPGFVYGGLIASLVDCHSIGAAAIAVEAAAGRAVGDAPAPRYVTASLHVDYLRPTPLGVPLEIRARADEIKGRRVVVSSTVTAGGEVCARGRVVAVAMPDSMSGGSR